MSSSVGHIEPPLAFHFEPSCTKRDVLKYSAIPAKRSRGKTEGSYAVKQVSPRRVVAAVADGKGGGGGGGKPPEDAVRLPPVQLHTARSLHMTALLPPLPFCPPLANFSQSIGRAPMAPAPARTEPVPIPPGLDNPMPELPPGIKLSYLAEGGANVVYRIILPNGLAPEVVRMFNGKLLRLRKRIDSSMPYIETIRNFDNHIRILFDKEELVDQELIKLPRNFIAACNDQLRLDEARHKRPKSRHGVYLSTKEPFGLLITDMTPEPDSGACLWEFKPKWLLQSPSAPPDAKRCRTCALRDMKNHDARKVGRRDCRSFCPFDLVSNDFQDVMRAASYFKGPHNRARIAKFLHRDPTLSRLRTFQQHMNSVGLPGLEAPYRERALSMTLRDCTMYVKIPCSESEDPTVGLGDLDFKSGVGGKLEYWRDIETRLIDEGWYTGTRRDQKYGECALQRRSGDAHSLPSAKKGQKIETCHITN